MSADTATAAPAKQAKKGTVVRPGDRIFSFLALAAGVLILAILAGVAFFLFLQSTDTIKASFDDPSTITGGRGFLPYVFPLIIGTLISAIISLIVASPFYMLL